MVSADQFRGSNSSNLAAMEQTRMLAHTLAQNNDPKFQVSIQTPTQKHACSINLESCVRLFDHLLV